MSRQREIRRRQLAAARTALRNPATARWRSPWAWAAVLVVVLLVVAVWQFRPQEQPAPALEKLYSGDACLLTGKNGVQPGLSAAAWSGVREGAAKVGARASFVPVPGPQTVKQTKPMLASLVQRQCSVIAVVDDVPLRTARDNASTYPDVAFVLVGKVAAGSAKNMTVITATEGKAVAAAVSAAVQSHVRT